LKLRKPILGALAIFVVTACSQGQPNDRLILQDGLLDIPVISGSKLSTDCGSIGKEIESNIEYACVEFPRSSKGIEGPNWDSEYTREIQASGWKWTGGESIAYYFEKPKDEKCNHSLTMLGWFQATEKQEKNYNETGALDGIENLIFIFGLDEEPKCGAERVAE
jgi:hypothetical protein